MCRHVCPIGNVTGHERNNARGRALSLSMVERGMDLTEDIVANVYECALCGACTKECATGWDPVEFTKEVRLEAAINGVTPDYINRLIDNVEKTGNPYGKTDISKELKSEIEGLSKDADILLFLGVDARFMSNRSAINAVKLLKKANVDFTVLLDEPDSGYAMDTLLGKAEETKEIMKKAVKTLNKYKTIIAYDPADAKIFMREYKEWDIGLDAKVTTFTGFIDELIKGNILKVNKMNKTFVFQDPAVLARDLEEVNPARDILNACGETKEMLLYGKDTMWAGNLIMNEYMSDVIRLTAKARWENALSTDADVLVTASPSEYEVLLEAKPDNMDLLSIEEVVLRGLE